MIFGEVVSACPMLTCVCVTLRAGSKTSLSRSGEGKDFPFLSARRAHIARALGAF